MFRNTNHPIAVMSPLPVALALSAGTALAQRTLARRNRQLTAQLAEAEARVQALQRHLKHMERRLDELPHSATVSARATTAPSAPPTTQTAQRTAASRPGSFDIDEDAAQRALERTLTQSGALLLPQGSKSITPGLSDHRTKRDSSVLVDIASPATGARSPALADQSLRRNEFIAPVEFRAGLPMEGQFEFSVPPQHVCASRRDALGDVTNTNGSGIDDITVGWAKTLMQEKGAMPYLIGHVSLNTGTGKRTDGQVALLAGYRQLTGEVVALRRQDPQALFASASYGYVFDCDYVKPGAVTGLTLGTVLATSRATTLQFGFSQIHRARQEINAASIPGSDETYGLINIGASLVLSRDVMLSVSTDIGVGSDAPKYSFDVALPVTF